MVGIAAVAKGVLLEIVRKKDMYVLLILLGVSMALLSAQTFFGLENVSRYVRDLGYSLMTLFSLVVAVALSARQIPEEVERRTVYPLLAKPISRYGIIVGKYMGASLAAILSFSCFFAVYFFFFRISGAGGEWGLLGQSYLLGIFSLLMTAAIAVFFSTFLTVSANVTLSLLLYFFSSAFSGQVRDLVISSKGWASYAAGSVYYLIPHYDFYDLRIRITHGWDALPVWAVFYVSAYTAVYISFLIYLSVRIFSRRQL